MTTQQGPHRTVVATQLPGFEADRSKDFLAWYQEVLVKGQMINLWGIGDYALRPTSHFVWKKIKEWLDTELNAMGVKNCYASKDEDDLPWQINDTPHDIWITQLAASRRRITASPLVSIMYPYYFKWIQNHHGVPLKLNMWNDAFCNSIWISDTTQQMHQQPLLGSREYPRQEGFGVYLTEQSAHDEVHQILDHYAHIYEHFLGVPVIKGEKTHSETCNDAQYTTTLEAFMPDLACCIQGAASHGLAQESGKIIGADVKYPALSTTIINTEDANKPLVHLWQTSWSISAQSLGIMTLTHCDDRGPILPPRVADIQAIIIPLRFPGTVFEQLIKAHNADFAIDDIVTTLRTANIRVTPDLRKDISPGRKFKEWELFGTPLRIEIGPQELDGRYITAVSRCDVIFGSRKAESDNNNKFIIGVDEMTTAIPELLENIQKSLYARAQNIFNSRRKLVTQWDEFLPALLDDKYLCVVPHCLSDECEDQIIELSSATGGIINSGGENQDSQEAKKISCKSICIPFDQPAGIEWTSKCINPFCSNNALKWCMFGHEWFFS